MSTERRCLMTIGTATAAVAMLGVSFATFAQETGSRWKYAIAPYVWGTSIDGTVGAGGRTAKVSANASDIVEFVDTAGALRFEALKQWGYFVDIWSVSLSNKEDTPLGQVKASFDQAIAEAGALYAFRSDMTGYFGARYQNVDGDITIPTIGKQSAKDDWTDAIIGLRYTPAFGKKWEGNLRADAGTGDSDLTWLAQVGVGYRFSDNWSGQVAYRHLDTDLKKDDFEWNLAQEGFGLGLVYLF